MEDSMKSGIFSGAALGLVLPAEGVGVGLPRTLLLCLRKMVVESKTNY
jgi:hypothetical protein